MRDEFSNGEQLTQHEYGEDDIESLLVQQIEFCNTVLLNKVSAIDPEELRQIKNIIKILQPEAKIIECDYANVPLDQLIFTNNYDFNKVANSAGWVHELSKHIDNAENTSLSKNHTHCHHHHHHEGGEADEYNISTFIYFRRPAFDISKLDYFLNARWPKNVIRSKGICYFNNDQGMSYLFEQSGKQIQVSKIGRWYATLGKEQLIQKIEEEPGILNDWDNKYGDRMQKIVFIGQHLDKEQIIKDLDACLEE